MRLAVRLAGVDEQPAKCLHQALGTDGERISGNQQAMADAGRDLRIDLPQSIGIERFRANAMALGDGQLDRRFGTFALPDPDLPDGLDEIREMLRPE